MQKAKTAKSRINQRKAAKCHLPKRNWECRGCERQKLRSQKAKKPRNLKAKKPRSQKAKKPRSQEAKKPRSQKAKKPRSQEAKNENIKTKTKTKKKKKKKRKKPPKINTPPVPKWVVHQPQNGSIGFDNYSHIARVSSPIRACQRAGRWRFPEQASRGVQATKYSFIWKTTQKGRRVQGSPTIEGPQLVQKMRTIENS